METLLEKYLTPDNITFMLQAAVVSVVIAALALTFGLCLGILGAAGRISKNKVAHGIATFYVETIRGTPMMLQILFFYLGVPSIVRSITGNPFNPSVYLIGVVALSGTVVKITQNYLARKLHGSAAPPLLSAGETI